MPKPKAPAPRKARASRGPDRPQRPNARPEPRKGGPKPGGPRKGAPRQDDARRERPRKDDPRRERPRKDDPRQGAPRQDDARRERPRKDDPRKGAPRQDDARRERPRKDDPRKGAPRQDERRSANAQVGGPRGEAKPGERARHDGPRTDARKGSARKAGPRPAPSRKVPRALRERESIDTPSGRPGGGAVRPAVGAALASASKSATARAAAPTATGPARSGTVAIIGRPNVGKSTLLNAALEVPLAIVTPAPQTTRETLLGVVHRIVDGSPCELALLDTPGLHKAERALDHRMNRAARDAASGADVVVFVADASGAVEHTGVHPGDAALLGDLGAGSRAVLVLNKIDRVKDKARLLPLLEAYAHARAWDSIVPLSARKPDGVDRLLDEIGRLLPEGEHRYGEDDLTDRPARFFAKEYVREQILLFARQEVPHAAAVSIDAFEEGTATRVTRVAATIHVEREGQKKILVGTGGSMLKQIGTDARMRLQEIVGFPVHLELFVRVTPGWRDAPAMLEELGIGSDGDNS